MNENFINDILNNEELKEKITKTQSKEEFLELLKEHSKPLKEDSDNLPPPEPSDNDNTELSQSEIDALIDTI